MTKHAVVPFYAADQPVVDTLCELIYKLYGTPVSQWSDPEVGLTENQRKLVSRIWAVYSVEEGVE